MSEENKTYKGKSALCIIVDTNGSTPRKAGAKMRVFDNGSVNGSIGGGSLEKKVIEDAIKQIKIGRPRLFEHHLLQEHEMCCGGKVKIYIEPEKVEKKLIVFGAGHIGKELALLGVKADFNVSVFDDRKEYLNHINHPKINTFCINFHEALAKINYNENTYIAILTYRHDIDRNILRHCMAEKYAYIGFIGSQRKILVTRKMFIKEGIATEKELNNVDMPIGLNIGAETPFEIAVSIIANMIAVKNITRVNTIKQINDIEQCLNELPL